MAVEYFSSGQASLIFFNSRKQSLRKLSTVTPVARLRRVRPELAVERRPDQGGCPYQRLAALAWIIRWLQSLGA